MMSERGFTPGPWAWFGNAASNHVYLATTHSGRRYVMDFVRWGMNGAQPRFQPGNMGMVKAKDLLLFSVGRKSIVGMSEAEKDPSVYRYDVRGIASADARLIAAAPDLYEAVQELVAAMHRYEGWAEADAPIEHLEMMKRAYAAIAKADGSAAAQRDKEGAS